MDVYMIKYNVNTAYYGMKKIVCMDYPYELNWDDKILFEDFSIVYNSLIAEHGHIVNSYYSENGRGLVKLNYLDHYVILGYRFANYLYKKVNVNKEGPYARGGGAEDVFEAVYYSIRIRGSIDLFYKTEIGPYFIPVHAIGAVIDSHAKYGKLFLIYNGVHIGPYNVTGKDPSDWAHPIIGDYVTLLGNSRVFGSSVIGNNVIVSTGTVIINEVVPDNCVISGISPNLYFMPLKIKNSNKLIGM
jgi:serine acetyltransferase